jgi:hypothetical protein
MGGRAWLGHGLDGRAAVKIFGWEWDCGCPDRVAESGTNNPVRYWFIFWPLHHGPVGRLRRILRREEERE